MAACASPSSEIFYEYAHPDESFDEAAKTSTRKHRMPFGAEVEPDGRVRFQLYGPAAETVQVVLEGRDQPLPMQREVDGWHCLTTAEAAIGSRYSFLLPDGLRVPDPASRFQPEDVHGPSEVIAPGSYLWRDGGWAGWPWEQTVLYELHIGTFPPKAAGAQPLRRTAREILQPPCG